MMWTPLEQISPKDIQHCVIKILAFRTVLWTARSQSYREKEKIWLGLPNPFLENKLAWQERYQDVPIISKTISGLPKFSQSYQSNSKYFVA